MAVENPIVPEEMKNKAGMKGLSERNFFGVELSSPEWVIKEQTFGLDEQHIQESLFTLGNGFIGSRGVLEEYPERAMPGTFITGVYDKSGVQVEELVNLPNPINFIIASEGEKLDMHFMGFQKHVRYLDMRKGLLARRTLFQDGRGRRFLYQSLRFFSMHNPYIGWMKVSVTLLNGKANLTAVDIHDNSVANYGGLIFGKRRHVHLKEADTFDHVNYYSYKTHTSKIWIAYADCLSVEKEGTETVLHERVYDFEIKANDTVTFTKTFSIRTSLQHRIRMLKEETLGSLHEAASKGFEGNLQEHAKAWEARWEHANVIIRGDDLSDRALRLNIYHLIIAAYKGNFSMSIGARALTGQGYRGHIFWDSEIFMLPFYIYTDPSAAREMLLYRYFRLNPARINAKKRGFNGALFPWESGSRGDDVTPRYAKDVDGSVMEVDTIDYEHHISGDIAYGVYNYYRATDDTDFMVRFGAEIIFSTAQFWASRVTFNEKRKRYEIRDIIGPDEFHIIVNNNAYTNILASWNMEYAYAVYHDMKNRNRQAFEKLVKKLKLNEEDAKQWKELSKNIYVPRSRDGLIEQFEGYFRKKEIAVRSYGDFFMPEAPMHLAYKDFNKTQFVKQADALLLFYLLGERFNREEKINNYKYYMKRTLHQSSLSHSTHALLASEFGDCLRAYALFLFSAQVDLKNLHNNTDGGMHMANSGGVWQAAVFGFAGIGFKENRIVINPRLPNHWKDIRFSLYWKKSLFKIRVSNKHVDLIYQPAGPREKPVDIEIQNRIYSAKPFKSIKIKIKTEVLLMKRLKEIINQGNFVFVNEDDSIKEVTKLFREKGLSSIPIVTGNMELCGIISKKDIVDVVERDFSQLKAKDVMNKSVEFVKASDHIEVALRLFTERSFQLLPVVKGKTLIGCITRKEVLSACSSEYY